MYWIKDRQDDPSHIITWLFTIIFCKCRNQTFSAVKSSINATVEFEHFSKLYKTDVLLPVLQSVARRLGQGEMYEGIALETDLLVVPKGASEIEIRSKQVNIQKF